PSSCVTLATGASGDAMTLVGTVRAVLTRLTVSFSIARRSNTTRTGARRGVMGPRTVSCGSSFKAVVPPTAIASNPARSQCTYSRAASPDTQRELPRASAIRPSIEVASLSATNGRSACWCANRNGALSAAAASASTPNDTATPWRMSAPTRGFGATRPQPRHARSRAHRIADRSAGRSESEAEADASEDMPRLGIEVPERGGEALVLPGLEPQLGHELHRGEAEPRVGEQYYAGVGRIDDDRTRAGRQNGIVE